MPFGLWIRVGHRNHVLDGGPDRPMEREEGAVHCKVSGLPSMWGDDAAFLSNYFDHLCYLFIAVYNCSAMSNADCSKCLSLSLPQSTTARFNCHWCQNGCQSQVTCSGSASDTCPPPIIHTVFLLACLCIVSHSNRLQFMLSSFVE